MATVALIPLADRRSLRPFLGRPLFQNAVEAAARSAAVERIVVLTRDPQVRDAVLAMALPNGEVVESDVWETLKRLPFETAILLDAEAPLLRAEDVRAALDRFVETHADSLVSGVRTQQDAWTVDGAWATPVAKGALLENGAIRIARREGAVESGAWSFGRVALYEMPPESLLRVDRVEDERAIEAFFTARHRKSADPERGSLLRGIRLVLSDVDGVLTDAGMYYGEGGDELKRFNTRDGKGFEIVRNLGLKTGIVTTENTALVARRAAKLRVDYLHQGIERKHESLAEICAELGIAPAEVAYIGDDLNDLSILREVGFAACPADAVEGVKALACYVCRAKGGEGAVRELCDLIAEAHRTGPEDRARLSENPSRGSTA